jgi:chemosensory pili system protein ChpC
MQESYSEDLYGLMIPLADDRLVLPRTSVAEVMTWQMPEKIEAAPEWLLGTVQWNTRVVPVVSIEALSGRTLPAVGSRTRIAIVVGIAGHLTCGHFGIVTQGFPQLIRANADIVKPEPNQNFPDQGPVICRVQMLNESPVIPDLDFIEQLISQEVQVA